MEGASKERRFQSNSRKIWRRRFAACQREKAAGDYIRYFNARNGWLDRLKELKKDPDTANIPIVMASILDDKKASFALGASDFVSKPVDPVDLKKALGRLFSFTTNLTALVVEDDRDSRLYLKRLIARFRLFSFGSRERKNSNRTAGKKHRISRYNFLRFNDARNGRFPICRGISQTPK